MRRTCMKTPHRPEMGLNLGSWSCEKFHEESNVEVRKRTNIGHHVPEFIAAVLCNELWQRYG